MICIHYNYLIQLLNISDNKKIIEFYDKFNSIYAISNNDINTDENIYCKYCGEKIGNKKDHAVEGFTESGSIMNFRDEDITDADKHAKCRISNFSGNDSSIHQ